MMSLWQTAHAATLTLSSPGPGGSSWTSSTTRGSPNARQTAARIPGSVPRCRVAIRLRMPGPAAVGAPSPMPPGRAWSAFRNTTEIVPAGALVLTSCGARGGGPEEACLRRECRVACRHQAGLTHWIRLDTVKGFHEGRARIAGDKTTEQEGPE